MWNHLVITHTYPEIKLKSNDTETDSSSEDDLSDINQHDNTDSIMGMLPEKFDHKLLRIIKYDSIESFQCTFKLKLDNEGDIKSWIAAYNSKTKETMVFDCCKTGKGKRVLKKFYLRCQHKQRQTGKHTKSDRILKTTHKTHSNRNTNCPAQIIITLLAPSKNHHGFSSEVILKHSHNHLVHVADALRFRRMSKTTIEK